MEPTYERIKLLELKQSKLADVPMSLPISIPEPIAHIDPPQHYFSFDEESTTLDQQGCVPPPPPDVEPPLATEEYDYAYEDPVLSDSAWAMFEHEHHDYTLNPDIFSTSFSTDFFEKNLSAKEDHRIQVAIAQAIPALHLTQTEQYKPSPRYNPKV
ncbi:hypothetical protein BN14_01868 [Rhizoctonia solani AG-1 IB]|uniref:Uncharacterized protein n=1 Tax=Thanatephorus cucumeris (strain AG1-IB / isolate 7/3/14) TaxID=1108050 RepID=M5BLX5_THACB|nr:hypothetical protein BN14_01868 [Rhizoctonia solani AG-1 IB]